MGISKVSLTIILSLLLASNSFACGNTRGHRCSGGGLDDQIRVGPRKIENVKIGKKEWVIENLSFVLVKNEDPVKIFKKRKNIGNFLIEIEIITTNFFECSVKTETETSYWKQGVPRKKFVIGKSIQKGKFSGKLIFGDNIVKCYKNF